MINSWLNRRGRSTWIIKQSGVTFHALFLSLINSYALLYIYYLFVLIIVFNIIDNYFYSYVWLLLIVKWLHFCVCACTNKHAHLWLQDWAFFTQELLITFFKTCTVIILLQYLAVIPTNLIIWALTLWGHRILYHFRLPWLIARVCGIKKVKQVCCWHSV